MQTQREGNKDFPEVTHDPGLKGRVGAGRTKERQGTSCRGNWGNQWEGVRPAGTWGLLPTWEPHLGVHTLRIGPGPPAPSISPSQAPSHPSRLCPVTRMGPAFLPGESRFSKTQLPRPMVAAGHPYLRPPEPRVQRLAPCAYQIPAALIALWASDPVGEGGVQVSRSLGTGPLHTAGLSGPGPREGPLRSGVFRRCRCGGLVSESPAQQSEALLECGCPREVGLLFPLFAE